MQVVKPVRVKRSYIQKIDAPPQEVFLLLCPVREAEWVSGWDPRLVVTESGFAEKDCVFITGDPDDESVWMITRYDRERMELEIVKLNPGATVGRITIALEENAAGTTDVHVTYRYTALSDAGEAFVEGYTEEYFADFMHHFEAALNGYVTQQRGESGRS